MANCPVLTGSVLMAEPDARGSSSPLMVEGEIWVDVCSEKEKEPLEPAAACNVYQSVLHPDLEVMHKSLQCRMVAVLAAYVPISMCCSSLQ